MKKRIAALLLFFCMAMALVACGDRKMEVEDQPTEQEEQQQQQPAEEVEEELPPEEDVYIPAGTNPLTGLPMEPEYESNRPIAVMFNNLKAAQPQIGISQADIIYEVPAEGGITRMMGVYQTLEGIGNLGSIRSTRPYYLELALGHDALLVHAGASPDAYDKIKSWDVDNMDGVNGGPSQDVMFWRDSERRKTMGYEHSMLTSGERVLSYLAGGKYQTLHGESYTYAQPFAAEGSAVSGSSVSQFQLKFSNYKTGEFIYNKELGRYLVSQYGGAYMDGGCDAQVSAVNVLVLETDVNEIAGDKEGRLTVRTTGSGSGTYFCGGKAVDISWQRESRNAPFVYSTKDGEPLVLQQGNSYVCLMDTDRSTLTVAE